MGNTNVCCPIPWDVFHGIPIGIPFPWTSLLFRNTTTFDALLENLRHASINWWKVNKNKNIMSLNSVVVFYCYFNAYYSSK